MVVKRKGDSSNKHVVSHTGKKLGEAAPIKHPIVQRKIGRCLKLSVKEGSTASVSNGFGLSYFPAFALAMNATASQVGILHAIIGLLPGILQLKGSQLIKKFSRKRIILWGVMFQILIMLPMILAGYLFVKGVPHMVWVFIVLVGLFYAAAATNHPAWFSWMGSLVPEEDRGKYFSKRNRVAGLFSVLALIVGALLLDFTKRIGSGYGQTLSFTILGFGILFFLSSVFRFFSWLLLVRQYEPRLRVRKKDCFSLRQFLKRAPHTPFGRFTIFRGAISVAIGLAAPFWAVYMLRDLGFSYVWFIAITISGTLFQLMFLPLLGTFSDRYGNVKLMKTCAGVIFIIPLLWMVSALIGDPLAVRLYLLFVPGMVSGFAFAGYNLATNNYVYDAVCQQKRGFGVSYMSLMVGVGTFVGAGIGSLIAWIGVPFMSTILFIFLISSIARFFIVSIGARYLDEVREVKECPPGYILTEINPMQGITREFHHLEHIVKKVEHYI